MLMAFGFFFLLKVDWPLNIVVTENCMNKYNKIFSFLLQLKHMVWTLKDVWFHLKRTGKRIGYLLTEIETQTFKEFR